MIAKQKKRWAFFLLILSMLCAGSAAAQEGNQDAALFPDTQALPVIPSAMPESAILPDVKTLEETHPERIVFTHYKLARTEPDFDAFAKTSPLVTAAQDIDKSAMIIAEYNRIRNIYSLHDEKAPIVIHTHLQVDEYSSLQDLIVFDELNGKTYFQIPFYDEKIAIVPKDIARFNRIKISKARADEMFKALSGSTSLAAEFILKPLYADRKEPFIHNDQEYWLMLADIAEVRLWAPDSQDDADEDDTLVWYHRADWYKPEDKQNLGGLYSTE